MSQPPQGPPQPPYPPGAYGPRPLSPSDERTWAIVAHVGPPVISLITVGVLGFLAPLLVWLILRDRSAFVGDQAKESLNFQITLLIGYLLSLVLMFVIIGFVTWFGVWVCSIVFAILAAVAVNRFESYRYPINIRFIS